MNSRKNRISIVAAMLLVVAVAPATAYLTDKNSRPPANWFGFLPPGEGQSYVDAVFGTSIKRLTYALGTPNSAGAGFLTWAMTEYSTMSAFNSDASRFLLQHGSYFALYDAQGNHVRDLPFEIHASAQPRWSRTSKDVLYYVSGNRVKSFNVATSATATHRTFTEYSSISGHGESDIGFAGNQLVLAGNGRDIFVYDIATNSKGPVLNTAGLGGWDGLYLTPNGNVIVTWYAGGTGRYRGIELYNKNMVFQRQVSRVAGHMDVTRDTDGSEVMVYANSSDPTPVCANGVVKVKLATAVQSCLLSLDWSLATHISCPDGDGACIVETYAPSNPNPSQSWPAFTNELLRVPLDASATQRLAHHRSKKLNSYNYQPRATVSRDGKRLLFSSNFALQSILGYPTEYSDAYLIELGSGGTTTPPPPPPPTGGTWVRVDQNATGTSYSGTWFPNGMSIHSGGSAELAMDAGARATYYFQGTGVRWIGYKDAWAGIARVYLDGKFVTTVDTYSPTSIAQAVLFEKQGLTSGVTHTLVVEVTQTRNSASGGSWIWIDAFEAIDSAGGGTVPPPDPGDLVMKDGFETGTTSKWVKTLY